MAGYFSVLGALLVPGVVLMGEAGLLLARWRRGAQRALWPVALTAGVGLLFLLSALAFIRMAGMAHAT